MYCGKLPVCCNLAMRWAQLRLWVACFLLVVIPLKGFAAGMAPACHGVADAMQMQTRTATAHSAHQPQEAGTDLHHSAGHATDIQDAQNHPDSKCKACSPCCTSALPSDQATVTPVATIAEATFPDPLNLHRSAIPGGLERPPRTLQG
jgi:hypothetical protein